LNIENLKKLLEKVQKKQIDIDQAVSKLKDLPFDDIGFAKIDHHRQLRRGFPEVIYSPGKSCEQIIEIFKNLSEKGNNVLATRAEKNVFDELRKQVKKVRYNTLAKTIVLQQQDIEKNKTVLPIVSAGTSDLPVAQEAKETAEIMGQGCELITDVGVAGLHRVLASLEKLRRANVIIVVAGMEGALASVVGGLVSCPVIAVPTSVGYGANLGGIAALLGMLNSCSSGISVVNIDNGFSAAVNATLINRRIEGRDL
jgi:hypothetical protein